MREIKVKTEIISIIYGHLFTGEKDNYGKDIYEGDKLFCENRIKNKVQEVKFFSSAFRVNGEVLSDFLNHNSVKVLSN